MVNKPIEVRPNCLGGESLYISSGATFDENSARLLQPFHDVLTHHYLAIFRQPGVYLQWLARRARIEEMKTWLLAMADTAQCELQLHQGTFGTTTQKDIMVRCPLKSHHDGITFRLSQNQPLHDLPPPLQDVYELIDGILEIGAFEAGGLARLSALRLDASSFPTAPTDSRLDLNKAWWFYQVDNGDRLLALDDEVYRFRHEDGSVRKIGNLHDTIRSYFDSFTTGKRWAIPYG